MGALAAGGLWRAVAIGLAAALAAQTGAGRAQAGPSMPRATVTPAEPAGGRAVLSVPELPARRDGAVAPVSPTVPADTGHLQRDAQRRLLEPPLSRILPQADPGGIDPAQADALRRSGEGEREARQLRGGLSPMPEPTRRIEVAPMPPMPAPPRVALPPAAGQPGGPPIGLPTCGPAGCIDANGRALGGGAGGVLMTPEGRPCVRVGAQAVC